MVYSHVFRVIVFFFVVVRTYNLFILNMLLTGQAVVYNTTGVDSEGVNGGGAQVLATCYIDLFVMKREFLFAFFSQSLGYVHIDVRSTNPEVTGAKICAQDSDGYQRKYAMTWTRMCLHDAFLIISFHCLKLYN